MWSRPDGTSATRWNWGIGNPGVGCILLVSLRTTVQCEYRMVHHVLCCTVEGRVVSVVLYVVLYSTVYSMVQCVHGTVSEGLSRD